MIQVLRSVPIAKSVERQVSVMCRVGQNYRPPGLRQEHQPRAGGRIGALLNIDAPLAQLVEHLTCNEDVVGSIPTGGSIF